MRKNSISVAMAAYNGEKYIEEQVLSILPQLAKNDELLISIDFSTDHSEEIVQSIAKKDKRVRVFQGPGKGVLKNFEQSINLANNEIIFLADQDDYWLPGKVDRVLKEFDDPVVQVVMHDAAIVDEKLIIQQPSYFSYRKVRMGIKENILKNSYIGCCMAFRKTLKDDILPFPKSIPMHDQWIGLIGELKGKNVFIPEVYLLYRRHFNNKTSFQHSSLKQMIQWRINIFKEINKYQRNKLK